MAGNVGTFEFVEHLFCFGGEGFLLDFSSRRVSFSLAGLNSRGRLAFERKGRNMGSVLFLLLLLLFLSSLLFRRLGFFSKGRLDLLEEGGNGGLRPGMKLDLCRLGRRLLLFLRASKETLLEGLGWLWLRSGRAR